MRGAGDPYLRIRSCQSIPRFARIYSDMLGQGKRLPAFTLFVLREKVPLLVLSVFLPVTAIGLLFTRNIARSLYCMGILILMLNHSRISRQTSGCISLWYI